MSKKLLVVIIINAFCIAVIITCQIVSARIKSPVYTGYAAPAWAGESGERFAQLAAFFPHNYVFDDEAIYNLRKQIETSLVSVSLESSEERVLYTDAWSSFGTVSVASARNTATVPAIGIGSNFFIFHPLYLRDGSYINPGDIMRDRVVLDEELAWRTYGSVNLAGLEIMINGRTFTIAGVAARESGFAYDKVYDTGAGLYMSHEALAALTNDEARISNYEIVMPDIVTNFAFDTLANAFGDESIHIVDNTSRFSFANLINLIGQFGKRSIRTDTVYFPYWENAVRYTEDWLALLLLISFVMLICPVVFAVIYMVKFIKIGLRKGKIKILALIKKREDRKYEEYIQHQNVIALRDILVQDE